MEIKWRFEHGLQVLDDWLIGENWPFAQMLNAAMQRKFSNRDINVGYFKFPGMAAYCESSDLLEYFARFGHRFEQIGDDIYVACKDISSNELMRYREWAGLFN